MRPFSSFLLFFFSVVLFAFSAGSASADETSAKTRATLLELGLLPDLVLTNETELASSPIPITVNTNDCELTLFNYSALRGTTDPERPDMFKIVFKPGDAPALLLGTGFVHHGTTISPGLYAMSSHRNPGCRNPTTTEKKTILRGNLIAVTSGTRGTNLVEPRRPLWIPFVPLRSNEESRGGSSAYSIVQERRVCAGTRR